jgi:hypothetical protein
MRIVPPVAALADAPPAAQATPEAAAFAAGTKVRS